MTNIIFIFANLMSDRGNYFTSMITSCVIASCCISHKPSFSVCPFLQPFYYFEPFLLLCILFCCVFFSCCVITVLINMEVYGFGTIPHGFNVSKGTPRHIGRFFEYYFMITAVQHDLYIFHHVAKKNKLIMKTWNNKKQCLCFISSYEGK